MSFAQNLTKALDVRPYPANILNKLVDGRTRFNKLGVDRLLGYAGVASPGDVYPPQDQDGVYDLIGQVEKNAGRRVFQSRAIYYIFLDFSPEIADSTVAQYYAAQMWMSENEQKLVQSLWFLDRGHTDEAFACLGYDFELPEALHEYIVLALAEQKPALVASYLAARGIPGTYIPALVSSLATRGKLYEILEIARAFGEPEFLAEMADAALLSRPTALELAQLPYTVEEWQVVSTQLDLASDKELVRHIKLVRALHIGDSATLDELQGSDLTANLFIKKAQVQR